jgi:hypothetical protein
MSTYRLPERTAILELTDTAFAGAEIKVRASVPLRMVKSMKNLDLDAALSAFAEYGLISWNLADAEGKPLPATVDGINELDPGILRAIIEGWAQAISGEVPLPLGPRSDDGDTSEALPA